MADPCSPKLRRPVPRVALSIEEAASALALSPRTVEELVRQGDLPPFRVSKRWLIAVAALRRWTDERTAARLRLFNREAVARIRHELNVIDARRGQEDGRE